MTAVRSERVIKSLAVADPEFIELCEVLYGTDDADEIHDVVFGKKSSRDVMSEEEVRRRRLKRISQASNIVGLTAGAAAIGSTLQDDRLKGGGRIARGLHAAGQKIPDPIARRVKRMGPRGKAAAATGAAALQLGNVAGDVAVSQSLKDPKKPVSKRSEYGYNKMPPTPLQRALHPYKTKTAPTGASATSQTSPRVAQARSAAMDIHENSAKGNKLKTPKQKVPTAGGKKAKKQIKGFKEIGAPLGRHGNKILGGAALVATGAYLNRPKSSPPDPYVYKAAPEMTFEGEFSKFDEDKRTAFGWASVVEKDGIPIVDRQGDYISAEDIEIAAYDYVLKSRKGGDMHRRITSELGEDAPHHVADLIESVVFTKEKIEKMGLPDSFPIGWWIGMKVHDDETWQLVKKGERKGFSIHGKGKRVEKSIDELVTY